MRRFAVLQAKPCDKRKRMLHSVGIFYVKVVKKPLPFVECVADLW